MMRLGLHLGMGGNVAASGGGGGGGPISPTIFFSTGATDKSAGVTLSGGNLTASGDSSGAYKGVRMTTASVPAKLQFEVKKMVDAQPNFVIGLDPGVVDLSVDNTQPGHFVQNHAGTWYKQANGGSLTSFGTSPSVALNDIYTITGDETTGTVTVYANGTLLTSISGAFTNWKAYFSGKDTTLQYNLTGPFVYPQSGFSAYDS